MRQRIQAIKTAEGWWALDKMVPAQLPETRISYERVTGIDRELFVEVKTTEAPREPADPFLVKHIHCDSGVDEDGNFSGYYEVWAVAPAGTPMDKAGCFVIHRFGLDEVKRAFSVGQIRDMLPKLAQLEEEWMAEEDPTEAEEEDANEAEAKPEASVTS